MCLVAVGVLALGACTTGSKPGPPEGPAAHPVSADEAPAPTTQRFGDPVADGPAVPLRDVLADPARHAEGTVVIEGHVRRVCERKGCWMEVAAGPGDGEPGCRVTFKDYGFFVPTDSQGARARMEGRVEVETVPADHVEHLESEGARFGQKAEDGTAREVRLVATGVELIASAP
jgi:hypothetical protein